MKKFSLLKMAFALFAMTVCFTACDDDINNPFVVCPTDTMFKFDADGVPYVEHDKGYEADLVRVLNEEVVGHGWKWCATFEILENGAVSTKPYWEGMIGAGPSHYYFKSKTELVEYFYADAIPADCFFTHNVEIDGSKVTLNDNFYMNIFSIYAYNGRVYMDVVESMGERYDGKGGYKKVWGVSTYMQTTTKELKEIQEQYSIDFSLVV